MSKSDGQFVFMTCRGGAEAALKQEVARTQPAWRPAFSRPGFLTFKPAEETPLGDKELAERSWTFAHAQGVSLGRLAGSQMAELVAQVWQHPGVALLVSQKTPLDIHVWQREPATGDGGQESFVTPLCLEVEAALRAAAPEGANLKREATPIRKPSPRNSLVLDVVLVEPGEWWIGYHRAVRRTERWPGGAIPIRMPAHAVSRAYAKLQEAIQWSDLPLAPEDECVEIGCAPGGACQALLDRGMFVTGIDPADVDPMLLEHPRFRHLKKRGTEVRRQEFVGVRWLVADMNIAPDDTLAEVETIIKSPQVAFRGLVLTLKFSDWSIAGRLPEFVERVRGWGYRDVRTRQLVTGGQEICLVALRRKALRRLAGKHARRKKSPHRVELRVDPAHPTPSEPHF
jgi:23S rRNA (cytidine2498-2'-O)-methyltransferase